MKFWDTSALIPVLVAELQTARATRLLLNDPDVIVWTLTRVELLSALARRRRSDRAAAAWLRRARQEVLEMWPRWVEVTALETVRRHAERIVESHALRAADAMQIAAALVARAEGSDDLAFVTFDLQQAAAAEREGLRVLGPG